MKRRGLSLLEVLMASVILALTISGLASLFIAAKRLTSHARARVTASEISKRWMDPLHSQVRQDQWGNNCLSSNLYPNTFCYNGVLTELCAPWTDSSSGTQYGADLGTPTYSSDNEPPCVTYAHPQLNTIRKVTVTIRWQERTSQ